MKSPYKWIVRLQELPKYDTEANRKGRMSFERGPFRTFSLRFPFDDQSYCAKPRVLRIERTLRRWL